MGTAIREIIQYRSLLRNLVARDVKIRYRRSALGVAWTMLNPLLMMMVFTLVFAHFLRFSIAHFPIYFLCGFLLWNFFAQATSWSTACFVGYAPLLRKIYLPKAVLVLATVLSGLINLALSLVPLALLMLVEGHSFSIHLMFLPVALLLAAAFALGVSLLLAPLCVLFADIAQIYQVVLVAWMYLTPIFYPLEIVPPEYRVLVTANPMTHFVETFRAPIYSGTLPDTGTLLAAATAAATALVVGWVTFQHYSDRVAYHI
mgnify:CR=1 FL=1